MASGGRHKRAFVPLLSSSNDDHARVRTHARRTTMTTVSPFARSSVFDEPRLGGREQTVRRLRSLRARLESGDGIV